MKSFLRGSDDRLCKIKMIGEIRQNFTEASASVGLILATALIIVPNWVIWTWRFTAICFAVSIVTSLFTACTTWAGLIDLQFLEFSAFFPFLILTLSGQFHADGSVWLHWGFLALRVYGFDLSFKIIVGSYFGPRPVFLDFWASSFVCVPF